MIQRSAITKSRMAASFLAVLITASSPVALARTYLGPGGTFCSEYMTIKQARPVTGQAIDLWLLGYVSGLNLLTYATKKVDLLANQSAADVIGFVQGYCSANGDKTLDQAANEYWFIINKRYTP